MQDVLAAASPNLYNDLVMPYLLSVGVAPSLGTALTFQSAPGLPPSVPFAPVLVTADLLAGFASMAPISPAAQPHSIPLNYLVRSRLPAAPVCKQAAVCKLSGGRRQFCPCIMQQCSIAAALPMISAAVECRHLQGLTVRLRCLWQQLLTCQLWCRTQAQILSISPRRPIQEQANWCRFRPAQLHRRPLLWWSPLSRSTSPRVPQGPLGLCCWGSD